MQTPPVSLIVSSDRDLNAVLAAALDDAGYSSFQLEDLPSSADVSRVQPDVILLDLSLGRDFPAQLRASETTRAVPVIAFDRTGSIPIRRPRPGNGNVAVLLPMPFDLIALEEALQTAAGPGAAETALGHGAHDT